MQGIRPYGDKDPYSQGLAERFSGQAADFERARAWGAAHPGFVGEAKVDGLDTANVQVVAEGDFTLVRLQWAGGFQWSRALSVWSEEPPASMIDSRDKRVAPGVYLSVSAE